MAVLTVLILPIQEHRISFHFFESSLISFINVSKYIRTLKTPQKEKIGNPIKKLDKGFQ